MGGKNGKQTNYQKQPRTTAVLFIYYPKDNGQYLTRNGLINKILSKWWFVFPVWPPKDYDYASVLKKSNYYIIPVQKFGVSTTRLHPETGLS